MDNDSSESKYLEWWAKRNNARSSRFVEVEGEKVFVRKEVFSPEASLTNSTAQLIRHIPDLSDKCVLDLGTGSGILAIHAAKKNARHVVALDIDSAALQNAQENVESHTLQNSISLLKSDLYGNVEGKFDFIMANLPVADSVWEVLPHTISETYDIFLGECKAFLSEGARIIFAFASFGDVKALRLKLSDSPFIWQEYVEENFGVNWFLFESEAFQGHAS